MIIQSVLEFLGLNRQRKPFLKITKSQGCVFWERGNPNDKQMKKLLNLIINWEDIVKTTAKIV